MLREYTSGVLNNNEETLLGVANKYSRIIDIVIESRNSNSGSVTLQTELGIDATYNERIIVSSIDGIGFFVSNSAKNVFISNQNILCKLTGSIEVILHILIWEFDE